MVPDGQLSQNLPNPVRTLAAVLYYQIKNETGIKISIMATSKLFAQEKLLCQTLKGVHYESGSQNTDERIQLMISRRTPPPVRKWMMMIMMRRRKELSQELNHSKRSLRSDVRPLMKVKTCDTKVTSS